MPLDYDSDGFIRLGLTFPPTADWNTMPATPPLEPPAGTIRPAEDVDVTNPDDPTLLSLVALKEQITKRANEASHRLDELRAERVRCNRDVRIARAALEGQIKEAVAELREAKRIANALTPRKSPTKKAAK